MNKDLVGKVTLLLLLALISVVFLWMIRGFLMTILLAGIFSALAHPMYRQICKRLGERRAASSLFTLAIVVFIIFIPMLFMVSIVAAQGVDVARNVTPWVQEHLSQPDAIDRTLAALPFYDRIEPFRDVIFQKAAELAGVASSFLISRLSAVTLGTANFFFHLFLLLYTMFFFLIEGDKLVHKILFYLPLQDEDERRMLDRFTSVTLSTLKGTALIGALQGSLAGLGFFLLGIPSAVFWGAVMIVLSIIPVVGSSLVFVPAAILLFANGRPFAALALMIYCGLLVGSLDNVLRPKLVGKDTKMHELMILFGTLGGLTLFGVVGIFIGPIVAALFITVWDLYGVAFKEYLPEVIVAGPHLKEEAVELEGSGDAESLDQKPGSDSSPQDGG